MLAAIDVALFVFPRTDTIAQTTAASRRDSPVSAKSSFGSMAFRDNDSKALGGGKSFSSSEGSAYEELSEEEGEAFAEGRLGHDPLASGSTRGASGKNSRTGSGR